MAGSFAGVAHWTRDHHGLITLAELTALGVTSGRRRTWLGAGTLERRAPGIYRAAGGPPSEAEPIMLAVLAAGPGAVASHETAAGIWALAGAHPEHPEVSVPPRGSARRVIGVVHRPNQLADVDRTEHRGLPVSTVARTLVDLAAHWGPDRLEAAVDDALRRDLVTREGLLETAERLRRRGRAGVARVIEMLERPHARVGATESWLEHRYLVLSDRAGLPRPTIQPRLTIAGRRIRPDLGYLRHGVLIELDGHASHATRRERQADAERRNLLVGAGWDVHTFTYEDLRERPTYVVASVAGALRGAPRRGSRSPPRRAWPVAG